ncbi:TetR/AcrR family transcriptional regulator [Streptomyces kaempferi]|uniref:TetR/AcrR family transcriptional regulator n=1 Tax=Streptomyces kaempferi TaxID=333725 RepID=A0ABW3XVX5_9ACTN
MPRPPDPAKRHDLLVRVRAYMIRNGVAGLSLRPLAQDLGTSDRMLLYYFGTKERMVTEALAVDERRPLLRAQALLDTDGSPKNPAELRHFLEESWQELSGPGLRAALPLYLEVMADGLLHPHLYGHVMRDVLSEWTRLLTAVFHDFGMTETRARTEATVVVDASLGLLMAPLTYGDWDRADTAFHALLDRLEPGWRDT